MMKVPHLSWDTWLMMIILIEIEILSKYHFGFVLLFVFMEGKYA